MQSVTENIEVRYLKVIESVTEKYPIEVHIP